MTCRVPKSAEHHACSVSTGLADANAQFAFGGPVAQTNGRRQLYASVLSRLRLLMISRMAKPEEVSPTALLAKTFCPDACCDAAVRRPSSAHGARCCQDADRGCSGACLFVG